MKLYYHPVSTTSRPIMLLVTAEKIEMDFHVVDLFAGDHIKEAYTAINPNQLVPVLEDGDFRLTESSAILKYLAEKFNSQTYPTDLRQRARINERMDWFNTGLYRDLGYGFIYAQALSNYRYAEDAVQSAMLARSRDKAKKWLKIFDEYLIGPKNRFVCGDQLTIADYLGASMITLGEVIRLDYSAFPNITRWLANMKSLPYWASTNEAFYAHFVAPYKDTPFECL